MKTIILFEELILLMLILIPQLWVISTEQHIISVSVVFLAVSIFQLSRKFYSMHVGGNLRKKRGKLYLSQSYNAKSRRSTNRENYNYQNPSDSIIYIGINMCITTMLSIAIVTVMSQIVFIPMHVMGNSIAITMGIIFYTFAVEGTIVLPYILFKQVAIKRYKFALK